MAFFEACSNIAPASTTANIIAEDVIASQPPGTLLTTDARRSLVVNEKQAELIESKLLDTSFTEDSLFPAPTKEELNTLKKVAGRIPWVAWLLCLVEFAERASYYGSKQVFMYYLARPLPSGE